ncbi:MAG: EAL domain-containing protein [Deltaproteobacteria bacterium]|nr:EAL domain-containing protein [Deltaproteobacteria bacterium]
MELSGLVLDPRSWIVAGVVLSAALGLIFARLRARTRAYSGRTAVIEGMGDGVLVVDMNDQLLDLNRAARSILALHETLPKGQPLREVIGHHPSLIELFRGEIEGRSEVTLLQEEGPARVFDLQLTALRDRSGEISSRVLTLRDVSDRVSAREELKRESINVQLLQQVAVAANDSPTIDDALVECLQLICTATESSIGHVMKPTAQEPGKLRSSRIWHLDDPGRYRDFVKLTEESEYSVYRGLQGRAFTSQQPAYSGDHVHKQHSERMATLNDPDRISRVCFPVLVRDESFAVVELISIGGREIDDHLLDVLGHLGSLIGRAIERKLDAQKIRRLAFRDSLTQLPNRESFRESLDSAVSLASRQDSLLGLLFIDLDGFKRVNDNLGHSAGDELLCQVANRFSLAVRLSDRVGHGDDPDTADEPGDPVARLGGDEFTVLVNGITRPEDVARVAKRLLAALREPIAVGKHEFIIGASIGIACFPVDGDDAETLLQNADVAMYFAKGRGRNCYQFYTQSMNRSSSRRLMIEERLRGALERREFSLRYQPLRDAVTNEVVAAEALLRWEDPDEGFIGPDEFIPIAEESGLLVSLGAWVLREACRQTKRWSDDGFRPIRISVNLSGRQIRAKGLVEAIAGILEETELSAYLLELEITESTIMQDDELTTRTLQRLDDMGIGLALDDFGTGYSSINYLRHFPIRRLKIDRSFVSDLMTDPDAAALTGAIIAMAHSLRVKVVGEGVETEEQAHFLRTRGCEELQGYLISRPVCADEFERFLVREKDPETFELLETNP